METSLTASESGGRTDVETSARKADGRDVLVSHVFSSVVLSPMKRQEDGPTPAALGPQNTDETVSNGNPDTADDKRPDAHLREGSQDSELLWNAVGSIPRSTPAIAQFDDAEFTGYEEGELRRRDEDAPPANQLGLLSGPAEEERGIRKRHDRWESSFSESRRPLSSVDDEPTARKRSWAGSTVSEEDRRSARRPRVAEQKEDLPPSLPSFREFVSNPWKGMSGVEGRNVSFSAPVPTSTPVLPPYARSDNSYHHDEFANLSGHPPTLRGSSIDSSPATTTRVMGGSRATTVSRASSRQCSTGSGMEIDAELVGNSLLEKPKGYFRDGELPETEPIGPWCLRDALADPEPTLSGRKDRDQEEFWRGGYRPMNWQGRGPRAEQDEYGRSEYVGAGGRELREDRHSIFSALPNTKAWEYTHGSRGRFERDVEDIAPLSGRTVSRSRANMEGISGSRERRNEDTSHGRRAGRYEDDERSGSRKASTAEDEEQDVPLEWWQEVGPTKIPSILMREEETEDILVVVANPHSDRWTTHLSDPEEQYAGMSKEWMRAIWMSEEPVVLLTVFNYKFTKNQEVNRHIETSISAATTHLTGETGFHVVPPDPEWRHEIRARDLPYLWVIRGLSEAAVWEMVKLRVISTRGVSFITHPKTIGNPKFVCGLAGFLRPDVKTTKAAVLNVLEDDYMIERLTELVRSSDRMGHIPIARRVEKVLESLDIRFMKTKEDGYVANVYIFPPTDDLDEWRDWAEEMRGCRFNVFLNGTGTARKAFWCGGCRGVDHEDQECPIPKMKGWKGPLAGERTHTKFWEPESTGGRKPGRGQGHAQWRGDQGNLRTPLANGRGPRGGGPFYNGPRARGGQRGGQSQRGSYEPRNTYAKWGSIAQRGSAGQHGGGRGDWSPRTPGRYTTRNERY